MPPAPLTGKDGTFKKDGSPVATECTRWDFEPTENIQEYASDKTSGTKVVYGTVKNWRARIRTKVPATGKQPFNIGDTFTMQLHGDDSGNNYISGSGEVISGPVPCDIGEGQDSECEYEVGPRGPATYYGVYWAGAGSSGQ